MNAREMVTFFQLNVCEGGGGGGGPTSYPVLPRVCCHGDSVPDMVGTI